MLFFENLHSLLEQAGTISLRGLFKKRLLKKDFLPLVLTHLVTGDLDRNTSNYGLLVEENKPDKIIVFDFGEIVTQKNMDYLFNIIPAGLTEKDFEKPVEMVKELFSEEYINGLLAKSEASKNEIIAKKRQISKKLENIDKLIKDLIEQKKEEVDNYAEFCRENKKNISSSDKRDKKIQDSLIDDHDFKNIPPDKWKKIEAMINSLRQLREEESRMNQKAEKIECYKDYQDLLKTDNKHSDQHSALFEKYLAEISQFNVSLKDRLFSYYKSI
ncbi:hypothetical protein COZ78_00075 [bacterium (Candidatus Gribaldobacteria) CG_4_8_14_3_um_filter_42_11]|uniref:Uncharacterized protein n=1 Tax=bacterium (Candidatus Gribaldobacteria) CG_4_8_14_3_um_filter_42_11 TaxID=2014267 RepID=A0A2M7IZ89_9BACT|nr:MAG: hypothetical protein COZ78_00075 [bacterium (Candidatus Gribaldobacteria) CG_4_8_14_3_um_filter_42_11]